MSTHCELYRSTDDLLRAPDTQDGGGVRITGVRSADEHVTGALPDDVVLQNTNGTEGRILFSVGDPGSTPHGGSLRVGRDAVVVGEDGGDFVASNDARVMGKLALGRSASSDSSGDAVLDARGTRVRLCGDGGHADYRAFTAAPGGTDTSVASFTCVSGADETDAGRTARFGCTNFPKRAFVEYGARECLSIDDRGCVGVATKAPEDTLDVAGTLRCRGAVRVGDAAPADTGALVCVKGDATMPRIADFASAGDAGGVVLCVSDAGKVGVCTDAPKHALHVSGNVFTDASYLNSSDLRLKKEVEPIAEALAKVRRLGGYTFGYVRDDTGERHAGLVAQEVRDVLPECVKEDPDTGRLSLAYNQVIPLLVQAINELAAKVC